MDPQHPDDPSIPTPLPNVAFGFNEAFAELLPFHKPEIFSWKKDGKPEFEVPGYDVTSKNHLARLAAHKAPLPVNMNSAASSPIRRRIKAVTGYTLRVPIRRIPAPSGAHEQRLKKSTLGCILDGTLRSALTPMSCCRIR